MEIMTINAPHLTPMEATRQSTPEDYRKRTGRQKPSCALLPLWATEQD